MTRRILAGALVATALALGGCDLDLNDPNFPPEQQVLTDVEGLKGVAIGLQAEYADQLDAYIYNVALVTDEVGAIPAAFENFRNADRGLPLDPTTDMSAAPFRGHYRVIKLADDLLTYVPRAGFTPETASGMLALAKLYRAMALGNLAQLFERVPIQVGLDTPAPTFQDRATVLTEVLRLLREAREHVTQTPPTAEFNAVLAPGFNLPQTIHAMIARYSLITGELDAAFAAAQLVTVRSEFRFTATDRNPLFVVFLSSGNAYGMRPKQSFRLEAEPGDRRVAYWVTAANITGASGLLDNFARYNRADHPFPVYQLDEMRLIRAEVHARRNELAPARTLINEVRTQCPPPNVEATEPMACLPPLTEADLPDQAAVLAEILKQRRYELFLTGLRWEDLRRFGQPLKYQWIPYPTIECDRNPNAPRGAEPWQCR